MWEVIQQNHPTYMETVSVDAFVKDLGFASIYQAIQQCKVDVDRMKCYVHGKKVSTVKDLDDLIRFYEYTFEDSTILYQLCTQNSLAYVCEKCQELIPAGLHLGSGTRSHVVKIVNKKVRMGKVFRCFEIEDTGSRDTHMVKINLEVDLASNQVTMLFQLIKNK